MDRITEIKNRIDFRFLLNNLGLEVNQSGFVSSIYHQEKTPSCKIYFDTNRFIDYSSSDGNKYHSGDVIQFYQDFYNIDTKQAIKELAELAGLEPGNGNQHPEVRSQQKRPLNDAKPPRNFKESLSDREKDLYMEYLGRYSMIYPENHALECAIRDIKKDRVYNNSLIFTELWHYCNIKGWGERAIKYLNKERKIPLQALDDFKIFNIKNYNEVNNHLKKKFELKELQRSGLYNEKGNLIFYQHRIIVPYQHNGDIVYLRARYWDGTSAAVPSQTSKYLGLKNDGVGVNTPKRFFNSDVFSNMIPGEKLFITEGEFDAIVMESVLHYNCIAIPGVGNLPSLKQFERLKDFNIFLCIDNDTAGSTLFTNLKRIFFDMGKLFTLKELPTKDINAFVEKYG